MEERKFIPRGSLAASPGAVGGKNLANASRGFSRTRSIIATRCTQEIVQ